MKKVMLIAVAALAMTALVACNNNKTAEVEDTAATEMCDTTMCNHECDSAAMCCKAEGMAEDSAACCQKAEGEKCCKAEGKECPKHAAK